MQPDFKSSFVYGNQKILANWYTITEKEDIPDLPWQQVYAIGNLDGRVPLVTSLTSEKEFNLPGGGVIKNTMVDLSQVNSLIKYGEIGERMVKLAKKYFTNERSYFEK